MIRKLPDEPKQYERKLKKWFALLPVKTDDGYFVWFDYYYQEYLYDSYAGYFLKHKTYALKKHAGYSILGRED